MKKILCASADGNDNVICVIVISHKACLRESSQEVRETYDANDPLAVREQVEIRHYLLHIIGAHLQLKTYWTQFLGKG